MLRNAHFISQSQVAVTGERDNTAVTVVHELPVCVEPGPEQIARCISLNGPYAVNLVEAEGLLGSCRGILYAGVRTWHTLA